MKSIKNIKTKEISIGFLFFIIWIRYKKGLSLSW